MTEKQAALILAHVADVPDDFADMRWVTRGKSGRDPPREVRLIDLDAGHLRSILDGCPHVRGTDFELAIRTMLEC